MAETDRRVLEVDPLGMTIAGDTPALEKPLRVECELEIKGHAILGRDASNSIHLPHPRVSRKHAEIRKNRAQVLIRDLESTNGTFVGGVRIQAWQVLNPGDRIDVGPYSLRFTGHSLASSTREGNLQIEARNLVQIVPSGGKGRCILDDVTLVIEPCTFVALIGPSGSGKSTLMNALSARVPARKGNVLLNGVDLYANFEALKQGLALVPQHDVLHEDLTLEQALYFIAKLRLPEGSTEEDIRAAVQASVERTGLLKRNETPIKSLSGGQKKRASLSGETIHGPNLLFLDEVTSGLDEHTDREMMRLFREMADSGITVVCVTHTLANVEESCHKIIIMANPGVLAFYGTPNEAKEYFGVNHLAEVYACLAARRGADLKRDYRESLQYKAHVIERLTPDDRQEPPIDLRTSISRRPSRRPWRSRGLPASSPCESWTRRPWNGFPSRVAAPR